MDDSLRRKQVDAAFQRDLREALDQIHDEKRALIRRLLHERRLLRAVLGDEPPPEDTPPL